MRLLIVEDDPHLRKQVAVHFEKASWVVDQAADAKEARYLAEEFPSDIAIVDLGLPDGSGIDLIKTWRDEGKDLPLLILTARSDWQDKVGGLEAGADDYVTKPFYLEEVEARVNALLRRASGRASSRADYEGEVSIDFSSRRVFVCSDEVNLTAFDYNTLAYLSHRAGEVVSKGELLDNLNDRDGDRDSKVLEEFVGRLRKKFDPEGAFRPIESVRGAGYRFTLKLQC